MFSRISKSVLVACLWGVSSLGWSIADGETLPDVEFAHIEKGSLSNKDLSGKVTVVNFWATWCDACKVELVEMASEFQDLMKHEKVNVAYVSLDKEPEKARAWFNGNFTTNKDQMLQHLYSDKTFANAEKIDVDAFPMTLVIDQSGVVRHIQRGFKEGSHTTKKIADLAKNLLVTVP